MEKHILLKELTRKQQGGDTASAQEDFNHTMGAGPAGQLHGFWAFLTIHHIVTCSPSVSSSCPNLCHVRAGK